MKNHIFIYVTCKDELEAKKIAKHLLEKKLVVCANFFPIKSMYLWKGKINDDNEVVLILKTLSENYGLVKQEIKEIHSYDVPCIAKFDVDLNDSYAQWVQGQL